MPLNIEQVPGFIETVLKKYIKVEWNDVSLALQEFYYASRLFDKASNDTMGGPFCEWKLQVANPGNFQLSGPYAIDSTNRIEMMTHGNAAWSQNTTNYTFDITEEVFKRSAEEIVNHMDVLEHAMLNDYWQGMEDLMFSSGPANATLVPRPPFSLTWWIQAMPMTSAATTTTAGVPAYTTPGFYGGNPPGFANCGNVDCTKYKNWSNRCFTYSQVSHDDFVNKIVESMDKCNFKPPAPYAQLAAGKPKWELLTTYSRIQAARNLLQQGNDNIGSNLAEHADGACYIRNVPMNHVPAWWNSGSINKRTDGVLLGVNWSKFKAFYAPGLRMTKRAPFQVHSPQPMHNVRMRCMDDSNQIVCLDRRSNFIGTSLNWVTEND